MTNKAYIVANEEQEMTVLVKLEREGMTWSPNEKPTDFVPSECYVGVFPYVIFVNNRLGWNMVSELRNEEIVYDGRKEEQMSDKYVVSQEFMNELEDWKLNTVDGVFINDDNIEDLPYIIVSWWVEGPSDEESNNRLIAIIRWVNGEDVFQVEKPKKWVVRSKETDSKGSHLYVFVSKDDALCYSCLGLANATHFATKEEAQSWANAHQEVIEVEE